MLYRGTLTFRRIVVGLDLSEACDRVIGCLHGLRPPGTEEAILVHALGPRNLPDMQPLLTSYVEARLAAQESLLREKGFQTRVEVALGTPILEVNRIAAQHNASLIVIGTHGSSLLREVFLGRTAMGILEHATLPVLVVRIRITEEEGGLRCQAACLECGRHLLYCTDFSVIAERAFLYVEKIVDNCRGRVTLLHVQDKSRIASDLSHRLGEFNQVDHERLERLRSRLREKGAAEVTIARRYGSPIQEILRVAQQENESLIVMGSQGRGFISDVFLGSTSQQVVPMFQCRFCWCRQSGNLWKWFLVEQRRSRLLWKKPLPSPFRNKSC